jgi:hypothetical protein
LLAICAWNILNNQLMLSYGEFWLDDGDGARRFLTMQEVFGIPGDIFAHWYSGAMVLEPVSGKGQNVELNFINGKLVTERKFIPHPTDQ